MSNNKKFNIKSFIAGGTLAFLTVGGLTMVATHAATDNSQANSSQVQAQQGPKQEVRESLENNDYQAFLKAVADSPMADKIDTEEEFAKMVEMHKLLQNKDTDGAKKIADELGIELPGKGRRGGEGGPNGNGGDSEQAEAVRNALENNDFEAWKTAMTEAKNGEEILKVVDTQEEFAKMVEIHELREKNRENNEKIKTIHEELGLEFQKGPKGKNAKQGNGNN